MANNTFNTNINSLIEDGKKIRQSLVESKETAEAQGLDQDKNSYVSRLRELNQPLIQLEEKQVREFKSRVEEAMKPPKTDLIRQDEVYYLKEEVADVREREARERGIQKGFWSAIILGLAGYSLYKSWKKAKEQKDE